MSGYSPPEVILLGRAGGMIDMITISLETQFSTAQRGLRCRAAHGRRQEHTADFIASLKHSGLLGRHLGREVIPEENVGLGQARGAGRPLACLET